MVRYLKSSRATKSFCCPRAAPAEEGAARRCRRRSAAARGADRRDAAARRGRRRRDKGTGGRAISAAAPGRRDRPAGRRRRRRDSRVLPSRATSSCVARVMAKMFVRFVTMSTVTSRRSGCSSRRLSTMAARSRCFSRCFSRTRFIESKPGFDAREHEGHEQATGDAEPDHVALLRWVAGRFVDDHHFLDALPRSPAHGQRARLRASSACRAGAARRGG